MALFDPPPMWRLRFVRTQNTNKVKLTKNRRAAGSGVFVVFAHCCWLFYWVISWFRWVKQPCNIFMAWVQRNRPKYSPQKKGLFTINQQLSWVRCSCPGTGMTYRLLSFPCSTELASCSWPMVDPLEVRLDTMLPLLQQTSHPDTKSCTCVGFFAIVNMIWCQIWPLTERMC